MFKLELFSLLKEYKEAEDNEKKKIESSISKLIGEHVQEYEEIRNSGMLDSMSVELLKKCENVEAEEKLENSEQNDYSKIRNGFSRWLTEYKSNRNNLSSESDRIVIDIIKFYVPGKFFMLERALNINDSDDYDKFKNHIRNQLRAYFANQIKEFVESDKFKQLGFFERRRRKKEIIKILENNNSYNFNMDEIQEVLKWV